MVKITIHRGLGKRVAHALILPVFRDEVGEDLLMGRLSHEEGVSMRPPSPPSSACRSWRTLAVVFDFATVAPIGGR
jgi:hypothetical protein